VAQLAAGVALVAAGGGDPAPFDAPGAAADVLAGGPAPAAAGATGEAPIGAGVARTGRAIVPPRGVELPDALQTALQLQGNGRLFAEGYSSADFSHGPVVLSGPGVPILAIRPDGLAGQSVDEAIDAARRAGGEPWVVGGPGLEAGESDHLIRLPSPADRPEPLAPLATILPGQLLAEAVARRRGYDPDQPPGLQKVTLTR